MAEEKGSSVVSVFAMILLTVVVLVLLYFFVIKGLSGKKEIDVNIDTDGGSHKMELVRFDNIA